MAYRLVLDVADSLAEAVKEVVDQAAQAEVIGVERAPATGEGAGRARITVVAHALAVIDDLYAWLGEQPEADVRLAPLGGTAVPLAAFDAERMKARIQEEQSGMALTSGQGEQLEGGVSVTAATLEPYGLSIQTDAPLIRAEQSFDIATVDHVAIRVANMRRAEEFYHDFFQMDVVVRARRGRDGGWEPLPPDYDWDAGVRAGIFAEMVYLRHAPLALVVLEAGRAAVFHEPRFGHISLRVSSDALAAIRGQALVRSFPVLRDQAHSFIFRDPFEITWHITDSADSAAL